MALVYHGVRGSHSIAVLTLAVLAVAFGIAAAVGPWRTTSCCTYYLNKVETTGIHTDPAKPTQCDNYDIGMATIGAIVFTLVTIFGVALLELFQHEKRTGVIPLFLSTLSSIAAGIALVLGYVTMFTMFCITNTAGISVGPVAICLLFLFVITTLLVHIRDFSGVIIVTPLAGEGTTLLTSSHV
jgi:hypothetical protein